MTPERVAELRSMLAGTTRRPWRVVRFGSQDYALHPPQPPVDGDAEIGKAYDYDHAELIAAAVNALPELLDALALPQNQEDGDE